MLVNKVGYSWGWGWEAFDNEFSRLGIGRSDGGGGGRGRGGYGGRESRSVRLSELESSVWLGRRISHIEQSFTCRHIEIEPGDWNS